MERVYLELNAEELRDKCTQKFYGILTEHYTPETDAKMAAAFLSTMNVTYDKTRAQLESLKESEKKAVLLSAMDSIERGVESFMIKYHKGYPTVESYIKNGLALEAAAEEAFEETENSDNGSSVATIVAELLDEMADASPDEIRNLAKEILKAEKDSQDENRKEAEDEQSDFVDEGEENGNKDDADKNPFEDSEDGDKDSGKGGEDGGEDGNPFGSDGADGDNDESSKSGDSSDAGNPFSEGSEEKGEEGDESKENSSNESNPFGDSGSEESNKDSNDNSSNPFESYMGNTSNEFNARGLYNTVGIESGDVVRFVSKYIAQFKTNDLENAFVNFGEESVEFKTEKEKYRIMTDTAIKTAINCIATMHGLGATIDVESLKYTMV